MPEGQLGVAINAQIIPGGGSGGVEQAVLGLIHALGRLRDGKEEYVVIVHPRAPDWLTLHLGPNQRVVVHPYQFRDRIRSGAQRLGSILPPVRPVLQAARRLARPLFRRALDETPGPIASDGFIESLGVDVAHFPYQSMVLSSVPSIFNPWDLQHLHYPEFFSPQDLARREATYPAYCRHATAIAVASQWTKNDVIRQYDIDPEKVYVIPFAASTDIYEPISTENLRRVQDAHRLPQAFAFYPAQTWAHKNHIRLLEALALLRDRHRLRVHLVCTGALNDFWPTISQRIGELGLADQVRFLGFVPQADLHALYRLAQFVVVPSLFEGWGFPLIEAFREGAPVASSAATSLAEYAGDAALLFDPTSVERIAEALRRVATDSGLCNTLRQRGRERVEMFSWERTAKAYRALYRKVAGRRLSEEDEWLLSHGWTSLASPTRHDVVPTSAL
jgi:glycosyltransferase involved in cell wall biosynthesis